MSDDPFSISDRLESTAEWRRGKAEEFPDDKRNLEAAEQLERLAAEVRALDDTEIDKQISELDDSIDRLYEANKDNCHDVSIDIMETLSEEFRAIGFRSGYSSGREFLVWYRDLLQDKLDALMDDLVPVPDLDEQVRNDPAVKAAKQAYDEAYAKAYAKAYAEACKKL